MSTVLCCFDCRQALEMIGGVPSTEPLTISMGRGCEVHPTPRSVQAMHAVHVTAEVRAQWEAAKRADEPAADGRAAEDWAIVAQLAATLLSSADDHGEDAIHQATVAARRLVALAKRGREPWELST